MLIPLLLLCGFALPQEPVPPPAPPPATFVGAPAIDSTLRQSIANNTLDTRVALAAGARGTVRVVIVPAGTPHKFSQLDGPISYVVYRFEAPQGK